MKSQDMPRVARRILREGEFCYVAAATSVGPHLTPVVFAFDGGRLWLTTARTSAKARAWRNDPRVAGSVRVGDVALTFRGTVRTYDALDPFTWPSAALSSPRLGKAATKFSLKNARFFFGYAVDAYRVPLAWAPPGRVFVRIDMAQARVLDLAEGVVVDGWGDWPRGLDASPTFAATAGPAGGGQPLEDRFPESVVRTVGDGGDATLAMQGWGTDRSPLTVLPVSWQRSGDAYEARLPATFAALTEAGPRSLGALTIDAASVWRAAEMRGVSLRGDAETFALGSTKRGTASLRRRIGDGEALIRVRPRRAVWWEGWASGTVVREPEPKPVRKRRTPNPAPKKKTPAPKTKPARGTGTASRPRNGAASSATRTG